MDLPYEIKNPKSSKISQFGNKKLSTRSFFYILLQELKDRRVRMGPGDVGVAQGTLERPGKEALLESEAFQAPKEDLERLSLEIRHS